MKCMKWMIWHESSDMSDLKWRNWNAWIETNDLSLNELKWKNLNEGIDVNDLKWMNWHEWIENWNEWMEMKQLTRMNWTEWIKWIELSSSNDWVAMNELTYKMEKTLSFSFLCDQLLDDNVVDIWNRALATVSCTFCQPHFQKTKKPSVFDHIFVKSSSRYSLVHILSTSSSKSGPRRSVLIIYEISLQSHAHFVNLIFKKWFQAVSFLRFLCEIELSLQARAHFVDHFPDRAAHPRKQRPSSGDHGRPLYPKKTQGFAPESVFSRAFTRSRSLTFPNYLMMMWLAWWCGWHDWDDDVVAIMVRQLAIDNRP